MDNNEIEVNKEKVSAKYAEEYTFSETHRWANAYADEIRKKVESGEMKEREGKQMLNAIGKTAMEADYSQMQYIKWLKAEHMVYLRKKSSLGDLEERKRAIMEKYRDDPEMGLNDMLDPFSDDDADELEDAREKLLSRFKKR